MNEDRIIQLITVLVVLVISRMAVDVVYKKFSIEEKIEEFVGEGNAGDISLN